MPEEFEHLRQKARRDSRAVVAHLDLDLPPREAGDQFDASAFRRVFGRVVEEVLQHLDETHEVAVDRHGSLREHDFEAMAFGRH